MIYSVIAAMMLLLVGPGPGTKNDNDVVEDKLDSVVFVAGRVRKMTPVASTTIKAAEIVKAQASPSFPMGLAFQPSVVAVEEGGTGLGYTSIRIRGVGGYQTSVTLNGITLNDAESQEVFWVNIPGLGDMLSSVQLQRGLGTADAGPGSFGASINMATSERTSPLASFEASAGSFGTFGASAHAITGLSGHGLYAEAAFSRQHSDGYIREAPADVQSAFLNAGWKAGRNSLKITFLQGEQHTGITWEGIPFDIYPYDRRYNSAPGATDNFTQSHLQLNWAREYSDGLFSSTTLNCTRGKGDYDYPASIDGVSNNLYVLRSDLQKTIGKAALDAGVYLSSFDAEHFGIYDGEPAYRDDALKREADIWQRAEWDFGGKVWIYEELQYRGLAYDMVGGNYRWNFLNPRAGVTVTLRESEGRRHAARAFAALAHREPARTDLLADAGSRPERMFDIEAGYSFSTEKFSADVNFYLMEYRDMLLETGELSFDGYAIKRNVSKGHRRGIELIMSWKAEEWLRIDANACFSDNGKLLLSPSAIGSACATISLPEAGEFRLSARIAGRQHWDNSGSPDTLIPAYGTADLSWSKSFGRFKASAFACNLLNRKYYAYAYSGGVYPAAPINFTVKMSWTI